MINLAPRRLTAASRQEKGGGIPGLIFDAVEVIGDGGDSCRDDGLSQFMSIEFIVTQAVKDGKDISLKKIMKRKRKKGEREEKAYHVKGDQENAEHKGNHVDPERETGNVL